VSFMTSSCSLLVTFTHVAAVPMLQQRVIRIVMPAMMLCSTPREQLKRWLDGRRHAFQQACFDLIDLMRVDWHAGFSCCCTPRWHTADAIAIGMNSKHCFIERPHEAAVSGDRAAGNMLRNRLFVVQPAMRQKLLLFGSSTSGGLEPADLQQLRDSISTLPPAAQERTLLPLLQTTVATANGNLLAAERWRRTLHSLGSTAPADQLLPLVLWDIIDRLLAVEGNMLSAEQQHSVRHWSPLLHEGLRPSLGAALPTSIKVFLEALLKVCSMLTTSTLETSILRSMLHNFSPGP
jgi:hypothetical protein